MIEMITVGWETPDYNRYLKIEMNDGRGWKPVLVINRIMDAKELSGYLKDLAEVIDERFQTI